MTNQKTRTARDIAVEVMDRFDSKCDYAGEILEKILYQTSEKQRATDLVFGTIRNRNAIDIVIEKFAGIPVKNVSGKLLNIIRVAVFELIYSPATPDYSIVNEAVEVAKTISSKRQTGFVNAVLRQITRHITSRQIHLNQTQPSKTIPQTPATGCQFDTCFLPNSVEHLADYFSSAFSLPKWLVTEWLVEFGIEQTRQICFASNRRPSVYIRPNRLKTTAQELLEKLLHAGVEAEIVPENEMIKLNNPRVVTGLPGFVEGMFTIQDITASQAVRLLNPQPGWIILDLCAAPGVKTTQLAEVTNDSARIIATDISSKRLRMVEENTVRLGISSVSIIAYEQLEYKAAEVGPFDAVLLDVPCSNTGVLARRVETRYRLKPKAIEELARIQSELLNKAATIINPAGRICYSTCSIQQAENSQVIGEFLQKESEFVLESERLILPASNGFDCDGGYVAVLIKNPQINLGAK